MAATNQNVYTPLFSRGSPPQLLSLLGKHKLPKSNKLQCLTWFSHSWSRCCHLFACFRWRNFQRKQNCQFVPRCSNRNNPGELHSSVETCITRCPHCRSPSWRRLHLGINPEDTFTGEVHSKTSFLDTVPNSLTGEVNSNSSSLAKLSTGLVMFLQRFCFIASCYPGLS